MPACRPVTAAGRRQKSPSQSLLFFCKANTAGHRMLRACSSLSREPSTTDQPAVQTSGGDFFRYTDAEKILPLGWLPGQDMLGRLQSCRRWAAGLFASVPIPSRPSPWLRTNRPNMFCPGRQRERGQAASPLVSFTGSSSIFRIDSGLRYTLSFAQSSAYSRM